MKPFHKAILIIHDGWGIATKGPGNFISQAKTPFFDSLLKNYPHCQNKAAGNAVGLPEGVMGNSEVGHLHLGAGRIVWQLDELINRSIQHKSFFKNKVLLDAMRKARKSSLHLLGLCSDASVHSHISHLSALLEMAKANKVKNVFIHFFADGRDVHEKSAKSYVSLIEKKCKKLGIGKIASVVGRFYAMDRDRNWSRTKVAYELLTQGRGAKARSASKAISLGYKQGAKTDYYLKPYAISGFQPIKSDDAVIFFNFRTDRPRQLTAAFIQKKFTGFPRKTLPKTHFVTMTEYDKTFSCPPAFAEPKVKNNLGSAIANAGLRQLRLAETEKYAHVTYFFNSEVETPNKNEERVMIPSAKVQSFDLKPEMSAFEITKEADWQINQQRYDFILINFANPDLVGHSGVKKAIIRAIEVVDACTEMVVNAALKNSYTVCITADHGNAEDKLYSDGKVKPSHSSNPVNFILVSNDEQLRKAKLKNGGQQDVAPTILSIMGLKKPKEMTGKSLIWSYHNP